jgi:hypothetical protein
MRLSGSIALLQDLSRSVNGPIGSSDKIFLQARAQQLRYKNEEKLPKRQRMNAYDRELQEKLQKLESIDARLAQHDKMTRFGLIWLTVLAALVLAGLGYAISRL